MVVETPAVPPVDPRAPVPEGLAEVCVVRRVVSGGTLLVRDNVRLVGGTSGKGYFCYRAQPGVHRVTSGASAAGEDEASLDLVLAPGERARLTQAYQDDHIEIARPSGDDPRVEIGSLPYEALVSTAEPVMPSTSIASASASLPPLPSRPAPAAPPAPAATPAARATPATPANPATPEAPGARRRPSGLAYGVAAGLGAGAARVAPATQATGGFAAIGSLWGGFAPSDLLLLGVRLDLSLVNGATAANLGVHLAVFPAGERSGPLRDFMLIADGGVRLPTSTDPSTGDTQLGAAAKLGVGWESWRLGPVVVGPFLVGQVTRGTGQSDAAALIGIGASHYPSSTK